MKEKHMKFNLNFIFVSILLSVLGSGCSIAASDKPTPFPLPSEPDVHEFQFLPLSAPSSNLLTASVMASSSMPDAPASNAIDGNPETIWNSGSDPEQWIQLDLGAPRVINAIRLLVSQYPAGDSVHQIWIGADPDNLTLLHEFIGFTNDGDLLEFIPIIPPTDVRFIRIVTTQSTSWVAWREIEVEGE
ncbi:MAG: discoidin domain-containing protein [Chloroflexi bacterium]|nr:discoidin domain-containing protein [Chloroflexota bacterium]